MVGVMTVLLGGFATRLQFDFELEKLFPKGDDDLAYFKEHVERFGYDNDYLTIALKAPETIYDSFFVAEAQKVVTTLRQLPGVDFVSSPLELPKMVATPMGLSAFPMFDDPDNFHGDSTWIAADPLLSPLIPSTHLTLLLRHEHMGQTTGQALYDRIRVIMGHAPFEIRLIGRLPGEKAFLELVKEDFLVFLLGSLLICALVLWLIAGNWKLTLLPFTVGAVTLLWTFGLMGLLGIPITIMTSLLPPIILFVSSSDGIHLVSALRNSENQKQAFAKVFFPTFMTSMTTAIGFFSLMVIPVGPLQALGLLAGLGTLIAFGITYVIAPVFRERYTEGRKIDRRSLSTYVGWLWRNHRAVAAVVLVLVGVGAYFSTQLKVDAYLLDDLPTESQVTLDFQWADENLGGSKPWEISLWPTSPADDWWDEPIQREVAKITDYLQNEYGVARIASSSNALKYASYLEEGDYSFPDVVSPRLITRAKRLLHEMRIPLASKDSRYGRIAGLIPQWGSEETRSRDEELALFLQREIDSTILRHRMTGTTYMIDRSHGILARQIVGSLALAIAVVSVVLGLYFRSGRMALIALVPNIMPLLMIGASSPCLEYLFNCLPPSSLPWYLVSS